MPSTRKTIGEELEREIKLEMRLSYDNLQEELKNTIRLQQIKESLDSHKLIACSSRAMKPVETKAEEIEVDVKPTVKEEENKLENEIRITEGPIDDVEVDESKVIEEEEKKVKEISK